MLVIIIVLYF